MKRLHVCVQVCTSCSRAGSVTIPARRTGTNETFTFSGSRMRHRQFEGRNHDSSVQCHVKADRLLTDA